MSHNKIYTSEFSTENENEYITEADILDSECISSELANILKKTSSKSIESGKSYTSDDQSVEVSEAYDQSVKPLVDDHSLDSFMDTTQESSSCFVKYEGISICSPCSPDSPTDSNSSSESEKVKDDICKILRMVKYLDKEIKDIKGTQNDNEIIEDSLKKYIDRKIDSKFDQVLSILNNRLDEINDKINKLSNYTYTKISRC